MCEYDAENNEFTATFDGLQSGATYYYKTVVTGNNGTQTSDIYETVTTIERSFYNVHAYRNLSAGERAVDVKVNVGELLKYTFAMSKYGYTFCGWYWDAAFTLKYDMAYTQNTSDDIIIYAKWVENANTASLRINGATLTTQIFPIAVGDKFTEPQIADVTGYIFAGWYADAEFTAEFVFENEITDPGTYDIYAKLIPLSETTEETTTEATTAAETTTNNETTTEPDETVPGSDSTVIIIAIATGAVVILGGGAYMVMKKKKS
jgi:uncharacterized repeat protein (TIGR02543 family)